MSSFTRSLVDLSNQPMHPRCTTAADSTGWTQSCGWPLDQLARNGVLVSWEADGFPGWSIAKAPGTPLGVGGLTARWNVSVPGGCRALGATETITVYVARPVPENYYLMTACLRGPNTTAAEEQIRRMIDSTKFTRA